MGRIGVLAGGLALALLSAPQPCNAEDCGSLSPVDERNGYRLRGNSVRCEGLVAGRIAGGGIELVSLTVGSVAWDFARDHELSIEAAGWVPLGQTRVRAVGVPAGLYYRL